MKSNRMTRGQECARFLRESGVEATPQECEAQIAEVMTDIRSTLMSMGAPELPRSDALLMRTLGNHPKFVERLQRLLIEAKLKQLIEEELAELLSDEPEGSQ